MNAQFNSKLYRPSIKRTFFFLAISIFPGFLSAQQKNAGLSGKEVTLNNCIHYALEHNPDLKNARLNEAITEATIKTKLADWYPQINFNYSFQHNFSLPAIQFNGNITQSGSVNTSGIAFGATQNIFNRDVLLASRTARDVRIQAHQNTSEQNINLAAQVSKAFYDVILTMQQLKVTEEDIVRTDQSLKDAFYQYQSGIVDKTDYKRAAIALNNAKAQKKFGDESLKAKYSYLKQLMGFPDSGQLALAYDTLQMQREIFIDTLQTVTYDKRIEVRILETQKTLQQYNLQYYKWAFLPDVSAYGNYNLNFLNNQFSKLYNESFPNSYIGLLFSIPIFQGAKRTQQIKIARLQISQAENAITSFKNQINTQFQQAMTTYKSNLYNYFTLKENLALANEVYEVIRLQYRSGVKAYLDVITAETDLRTAQFNYYNALYQVLSNKIDVEQALGNIVY